MSLNSTVSSDWLHSHLSDPDLIILDATLAKPKSAGQVPYPDKKIRGAQFFDIDNAFSNASIDLPHMMCDAVQFKKEAQRLGINKESTIIIYDSYGVYSSPRAWWMLKSMGHTRVAVLDGGLPEWTEKGFETESKGKDNKDQGTFKPQFHNQCFVNAQYVFDHLSDSNVKVLDARSAGRFKGTEPEPRAGLRGGHVPHSISLPFTEVIDGYRMKSKEKLQEIFNQLDIANKRLIFSCGSGLTACIILLAAHIAGYEDLSVYDGSWSEWGQPSDLPVSMD